MSSMKDRLHILFAILTMATIVVIINFHDFLAKLVNRLVPHSQTGARPVASNLIF